MQLFLSAQIARYRPLARCSSISFVLYFAQLGFGLTERLASLERHGVPVFRFPWQTLKEGSYGTPVAALQHFLASKGHLQSEGGFSGYFGGATKEALIAWQRASNVVASGAFDRASKWKYAEQMEQQSALLPATHRSVHASTASQNAEPSSLSSPDSLTTHAVSWALGATVVLSLAAVAAKRLLERSRRFSRDMMTPEADDMMATARHVLSDAELEKRLAPFKGASGAAAAPRRVVKRATSGSAMEKALYDAHAGAARDPASPSPYGTYFGGRGAYDRLKRYLSDEAAAPAEERKSAPVLFQTARKRAFPAVVRPQSHLSESLLAAPHFADCEATLRRRAEARGGAEEEEAERDVDRPRGELAGELAEMLVEVQS
ncbi:hypothetical protein H632_c1809p0 [Helicosporidium sp. ATCC 50920]|nr:hypothetical protein H632_c1809p0 [Helicosporidium sp. ATCC 50920]|eukprot:KDD73825.1 hypothetical protein H632_c1809p0 [Helicosporidium sp. ATCC 50920]